MKAAGRESGIHIAKDEIARVFLARGRIADPCEGSGVISTVVVASRGEIRDAVRFDLVIADPPYAQADNAVTRVLTLLEGGWLADDALVVIERATRSGQLDWPPGFLPGKSRRYGEATFWYGWYGREAGAGHTGSASRSKA